MSSDIVSFDGDNITLDNGIPTAEPTPLNTDTPTSRRRRRTITFEADGTFNSSPSSTDSTFDVVPQRKRRRTSKGTSDTTRAATREVGRRHKASKLSALPSMPVDVLLEILRHLGPADLLKLTRINTNMRSVLLDRSASLSVWQDALNSVDDLPHRPQELSEPAWANLLFSPYCQFCGTLTPKSVNWLFRLRMCKKCSAERVQLVCNNDGSKILTTFDSVQKVPVISLVPSEKGSRTGPHYSKKCLKSEYLRVQEEYNRLTTAQEQHAFIQSRLDTVAERVRHAKECTIWERKQVLSRHDERCQLKEERKAAIIKKLEELGWGEELGQIQLPDTLGQVKEVNKAQELTERIWKNIEPKVLEFMQEMKKKRLERDYEKSKLIRKGHAIDAVSNFKKVNHPESHYFPEPPDYCNFPVIHSLVDAPPEVTIDESSFADVVQSLPNLFTDWRRGIDEQLKEVLKRYIRYRTPSPVYAPLYDYDPDTGAVIGPPRRRVEIVMSDEEASAKLKLAATVFQCETCDPDYRPSCLAVCDDPPPPPRKPLFYPQVMGHLPCLTRSIPMVNGSYVLHPWEWTGPEDPSTYIRYHDKARSPWQTRYLKYDARMSTKAEEVVKAAGLDPTTATSEDMDDLNLRFICNQCIKREQEREPTKQPTAGLYEWRTMVRHLHGCYAETSLATIKAVDLAQEVVRAEEERIESIPQWACLHCLDRVTEKGKLYTIRDLKFHLRDKHLVTELTLHEDYYPHFSAPDVRASHEPILVHWVDGVVVSVAEPPADDEDDDYYY